jgi:pyruvate/2-oxoglutarate dehydrogenase complex dihydrolipoamide dehydrogenase (E3) component
MGDSYDLVVIGAGPAGEVAAELAAAFGRTVLIVERNRPARWGGHDHRRRAHEGPARSPLYLTGYRKEEVYGVRAAAPLEAVMPTLRGRIEHVCDVVQEAAAHRFVPGGIAYLHGIAQLEADHTVHITTPDGLAREVAARAVLVATGSRPTHYPGIAFDDPDVYDSDEIYSLRTVPKDIVIRPDQRRVRHRVHRSWYLGQTGQQHRSPAADIDGELAGLVAAEFQRRRVRLVLGASADGVRCVDGRIRVTLSTGTSLDADAILVAAGRTPNTEGLGSNRPA